MRTHHFAALVAVFLSATAANGASADVLAELQKFNAALVQMTQGQEPVGEMAVRSALLTRRNLIAQLIQQDPQSVRSAGLPPDAIERLKDRVTSAQNLLEEQGEWSGSLEVLAQMDFEHHKARTRRYLRTQSGRVEMFGGAKTFHHADSLGGARMRIRGIRSENLMAVDSIVASTVTSAALTSTGVQTIAVLVVTAPATPTFPSGWNVSSIQNLFFGTSGSTLNTFWQEASYGSTSAQGTVYGPFSISQGYTCSASNGSDSETLLQNAVAAAQGTVNFANYNRVAIVFPNNNCDYGGLASVGGSTYAYLPLTTSIAWFPVFPQNDLTSYVRILAHEGGHNLGLNHANSEDYGSVPLGTPGNDGVDTEYGDPFSVMGIGEGGSSSVVLGQYSAEHKVNILGWLGSGSYQQVTSSGTYTVSPLEGSTGTRGLRILRDQNAQNWLWLEFRQPIGMIDSTLSQYASNVFSGALVHFENPDLDPLHTYLLDFNPASTPNNFYTSAMTPGQSWADPYSMLHLSINTASSAGLSATVSYDSPCATLAVSPTVIPYAGGTGTVQVTANSNCSWTASSGASWITLAQTSGEGNGTVSFTAPANPTQAQRNGIITVQRQSVSVVQEGPDISVVSVSPNHGGGNSGTFTFKFANTRGYSAFDYVDGIFGSSAYANFLCYFSANTGGFIWLQNDSGTAWLGPVFLNQPGTSVSNSSCTIYATGSSITGSGDILSVAVNLKFLGTKTGQFGIFGLGHDSSGYSSNYLLGTWTATNGIASTTTKLTASPSPSTYGQTVTLTASVTPATATGAVAFMDGSTTLGSGTLSGGSATLTSSTLALGTHSLSAVYSGDSNDTGSTSSTLMQVVDASISGTVTLSASGLSGITMTLSGSQTGTATTNSSGAYSFSVPTGGNYTVTPALSGYTFTPPSLSYNSLSTIQSGANFTASAAVHSPSVVSLSPVTSVGANQSYVFQFGDTAGSTDLSVLNVLINTALDGRQACYLAYVQQSNTLYLVDDAGDAGGPYAGSLVLNGSGNIHNSQCTVNGVGSSAVGSGNTLTLTLNLAFSTAFAGNKVVYMAARDSVQDNTGWQTMGVHGVLPLPAAYPNPAAMTPSSGSTANPVLSFTFEDASTATNLQTGWALINTAIDGRSACYVAYYRPGNQVYLYPDNGDGTQATSMVLTGTNSVSNSQCTISAQGSSVTTNGAELTVDLNVSFKAAFAGPKGVWMAVQTTGGAQTSAWQALGAWQVP